MDFNVSNMTNFPQQSFDFMNIIGSNPIVIIVLVVIIAIYYLVFALLGNKSGGVESTSDNGSTVFVEALLWGVFIVLILLNGVTYFFNIDISSSIKNIFSPTPEIAVNVKNRVGDIGSSGDKDKKDKDQKDKDQKDKDQKNKVKPSKSGSIGKQVFNIPGNEYTYLDAEALCRAYDSELASYDKIYDAYKNGAEWCNYGWSADQMAFFPTQEDTWKKLQGEKGHEHDCGRVGINGGYIANPNVRFGVNCYGTKPKITSQESKLMQNQQLVPETLREMEIDKRTQQFKNSNLNDILISPFNRTSWNKV